MICGAKDTKRIKWRAKKPNTFIIINSMAFLNEHFNMLL